MSYPVNKVKVELGAPVDSGGEKIHELTVRVPRVWDQILAAKQADGIDQDMVFFSNLCDVDREVIESLDLRDYEKLQAAIKKFAAESTAKAT